MKGCVPENNKIILVALHSDKFPFVGESQGICAISGYLKQKDHSIDITLYDQQLHSLDTIIDGILLKKPLIIGISVKMKTFNQLSEFMKLFEQKRDQSYSPLVVLGNSTAHFNGEKILNDYFPFVIISLGEGEVSMGDLYEYVNGHRDIENVRNVMYLGKDGIVRKNRYEYFNAYDIPISDRRYSKIYYKRGGEVYIEGSRGCAYCNCNICECRDFLGARNSLRWRSRNVDSIITEMLLLKKQGINSVTFSDEDFIGNDAFGLERASILAQAIIDCNANLSFRVNVRVKSLYNANDDTSIRKKREQLLIKLKKAGLSKIFIGLESGSPTQLKRYNKGFRLQEFVEAKNRLEELGIEYEAGFIMFDPLMNINELKENMDFLAKNNCIGNVSSIYKELRIQRGNREYVEMVRQEEIKKGIQIIGSIDFQEQEYTILNYIDDQVRCIRNAMKEYDNYTYKEYYAMRINTQYSSNSENVIFVVMNQLKKLEYDLLIKLIKLVETYCDNCDFTQIVEEYKKRKISLISKYLLQ